MFDVKTFALSVVAALAIGVVGGMHLEKQLTKAKTAVVLNRDAKVSAKGIEASVQKDQAIEAKVQQGNKTADAQRDAALDRVTKQLERTHDLLQNQIAPQLDAASKTALAAACDNPHLDAGTVRLLNDARKGAVVVAPGSGDAARPATAAPASP